MGLVGNFCALVRESGSVCYRSSKSSDENLYLLGHIDSEVVDSWTYWQQRRIHFSGVDYGEENLAWGLSVLGKSTYFVPQCLLRLCDAIEG